MASAENSNVGLAKQTAKGTINSTDASFKYFMFNRGGISPNNQYIPADDGIGSGSLSAGIEKGGVFSAGAFELVPRPEVVGHFIMGALGKDTVSGAAVPYTHTFTFNTDEFDVPYYTFRSKPGALWGETFKDCRIASVALNWRAADHLRAAVAVVGGTPTGKVTTTLWAPATYLDTGPSFLAPTTVISTLDSESLKVLRGSIVIGNAIPLDEQWVTGAYEPEGFDIVSRQVVISLLLKVVDEGLYTKMMYDAAETGAWAAGMLKEAAVSIEFKSSQLMSDDTTAFSLKVEGNGDAAGEDPNIAWSVAPISLQAGRVVTMMATGTFLKAPPASGEPITITLKNEKATAY